MNVNFVQEKYFPETYEYARRFSFQNFIVKQLIIKKSLN